MTDGGGSFQACQFRRVQKGMLTKGIGKRTPEIQPKFDNVKT